MKKGLKVPVRNLEIRTLNKVRLTFASQRVGIHGHAFTGTYGVPHRLQPRVSAGSLPLMRRRTPDGHSSRQLLRVAANSLFHAEALLWSPASVVTAHRSATFAGFLNGPGFFPSLHRRIGAASVAGKSMEFVLWWA